MPLETATYVNDLTPANPLSADPAGQGDDHLRLIKSVAKNTFPNMGAQLGFVRSQDTAASLSSTWNTNHIIVSNSATATTVLTLPPAASITSGFYVDLTTLTGANVSLLPSGAASINGGASFAIPAQYTARAFYTGSSAWRVNKMPNGISDNISISGNLTVGGTTTLSGTVVLSNGQLQFPATQNASADPNTLDDYEEGTWTPTLTFATPGNLAVVYTTRLGTYTKVGRLVTLAFAAVTSGFSWTTSSGQFQITGAPFSAVSTMSLCGISAGHSQPAANLTYSVFSMTGAILSVTCCGMGVSPVGLSTTTTPNGSAQNHQAAFSYFSA